MKFSLKWLSKYVNLPLNNKEEIDNIIKKIAYQIVDVDEVFYLEDDIVLEVDNKIITNRPYCFGHRGLAREIAIMIGEQWNGRINPVNIEIKEQLPLSIEVKEAFLCPRFTAIVIKNVKIKDSPSWLKSLLESIGQRSINNLVDITNYIMFDTGQPVHAYDYDKVFGGKIIVRKAKNDEKIITLDNVERNLKNNYLVIADPNKPIGIAGIMGSLDSSVDKNTKNIILEVASFHPINIRSTSKELKHRTEAVTRFEKGPDPTQIPNIMNLMIQLVLELCEGEIASNLIDISNLDKSIVRTQDLHMNFDTSRISKLLGFNIDENFVEKVFSGFEIKILKKENKEWLLKIPTYRSDIKEPADLIEDIGRMYGYQNIPNKVPNNLLMVPSENEKLEILNKARKALTASGLDEVITYPFISEKEAKILGDECIKLLNPQSKDYEYLRTSLCISLAKVVSNNAKNFYEFGVFEISRIFLKNTNQVKRYEEDHGESLRPIEKEVIAGSYYKKNDINYSIFKLKGCIENLLEQLNIKDYKIKSNGEIYIDSERVGEIKILTNQIIDWVDLDQSIPFFEIHLEFLEKHYIKTKQYQDYIKYQGSKIEFSVLVPEQLKIENLESVIPNHEWIQSFKVEEVYRSKTLDNKKSVLISFVLQNPYGNINSNEIYDLGVLIENKLKEIKNLEIRGEGMKKPKDYQPSSIVTQELTLNTKFHQLSKTKSDLHKVKNKIVIGKIIEVKKHPNADKLSICKIDVGNAKPQNTLSSNYLQIITGAENIKPNYSEGAFVPVALPGAYVYSLDNHEKLIKIKVSKIRGEISEGMLCSAKELGINNTESNGILVLEDKIDSDIGKNYFDS